MSENAAPMRRYACTVCAYAYDPGRGDPDHHVPPNTPFDDVPSGWRCPWCAAPKTSFIAAEEQPTL